MSCPYYSKSLPILVVSWHSKLNAHGSIPSPLTALPRGDTDRRFDTYSVMSGGNCSSQALKLESEVQVDDLHGSKILGRGIMDEGFLLWELASLPAALTMR